MAATPDSKSSELTAIYIVHQSFKLFNYIFSNAVVLH